MSKIILASGPVIVEEDKLLLVKEGSTDFWKFPGGKIEDCDKTLIAIAKRESIEELNIGIEILNPKPFILYINKETAQGPVDAILVHYHAKRLGKIKPGKDIREWAWIPILELDELAKQGKLMPNIISALKHFNFI